MLTVAPRPYPLSPGEPGLRADRPSAPALFPEGSMPVSGATASAPPILPEAIGPGPAPDRAGAPGLRPASQETSLPAGESRAPSDTRSDRDMPRIIPVRPGAPQSLARIPTEIMEEISRLRAEAEQARVGGVPGRNDPTPMPASPQSIGGETTPYGAA